MTPAAPNVTPHILFVADLNVYAKGHCRAGVLGGLPVSARLLTHTVIGGDEKGHPDFSLSYRIAHKLGITLDTENVNAQIRAAVQESPPDLIWIEKGNMVSPATLTYVRHRAPNAVLVSYAEDDMALAHNRSRAFTAGLGQYDCVFTTKGATLRPDELPRLGARRVVLVDKAYDPSQHHAIDLKAAEETALGSDVGFVGTFEEPRARSMLHLAENGVTVRVWGNGWTHWSGRHPNLRVEGKPQVNTAQNLAYSKTICATKINLGFLRKLNRDTHTDRSMEIPACGGFMLAERSDDHCRLFAEGQEAEFFGSDDELLDKVRFYLNNETARLTLAKAGHARARASGYGEDVRFKKMLETALDRPLS